MSVETLREVLLWCAIVNYGVLLVWFAAYTAAHHQVQQLWARWFHLSPAQLDALCFGSMAAYKLAVLVFNVVPWLALGIVGAT
ncbi:MAG: hypothetical protein KIT14_00665 [bacterium]|nr:hypothetical protein [bacterium]